jgi:hypothetical protein
MYGKLSDKMMFYRAELLRIGLCRSYRHFVVKLPRVGRKDFGIKITGQRNGNVSLAHRGRSGNNNKIFPGIYQKIIS